MISRIVLKDVFQKFKSFTPEFSLTSGILAVIAVSFVLFTITSYFGILEDVFSLGTSVFVNGHVHKLLTYSFYHESVTHLLLSIGVLVPLCSSFERSVGTVRFLFLFLLLSICTGVLYTLLELLLFDASSQSQVGGLVPVSLTLMGVTTVHSRMAKAFLFGVSVPTIALPWLFLLIITLLIPHTVFLCNAMAIMTGWIYGKGWLSFFNMSEARAAVLDKKMPFRLLRSIGVLYVPALLEERRKTLHPRVIPTPGSYPVQAYAPLSSTFSMQATGTIPKTFEGWPHYSYYTQGSPITPSASHGHSHEHSCNHSHNHSHSQGHRHSHEHNFGLGHLPAASPQTRSHWTPVGPQSHSQHSHLSPLTMFAGQSARDPLWPTVSPDVPGNMPESLPASVTVHPGAPVP